MEPTDAELIVACRAGDTQAFATLVERHQTMACAVTYSATGDRALSEDLAQDAFILAWRRLGQLDDPDRFRPWLCGVARNLARNAKRKRRHEVAMHESTEIEADAPGPAEVLSDRQEERAMWRALEDVPETYREPLVLFYREGQSTKQVAAALGISAGAVEQRLSRGRKHLRDGVAELVAAGLARTAMPAAGFTAAVMAGIAALPGEAAAADRADADAGQPSTGAASASVLGAIASSPGWLVVGVGTLAVVAALAVGSRSADDEPTPREAAAVVDEERAPAAGPDDEARAAWASRESARADAAKEAREAALARLPLPSTTKVEAYELSVMSPRQVAVALDGGATQLSIFPGSEPPEELPVVRHWRGRVVDGSGAAVAGAVVLAGPHPRKMLGNSILAAAGAVSDGEGRFDLALATADPVTGLAMRSGTQWSAFESLGPGDEDIERDVVIGQAAAIHGRVTHGGKGVTASIVVRSDTVELSYVTEPDGRFAIAPLPPGTHVVRAREGGELVFPGAWVEQPLTVEEGDDVRVDVDLPIGSLVAFDLVPPEDADFQTVTYTTLAGEHELEDADGLKAAYDAASDADRRQILHGGIDLDDPAQLADVPAGPITACVHGEHITVTPRGQPRPPDETVFFACRVVEVGGPGTVTPVVFEL